MRSTRLSTPSQDSVRSVVPVTWQEAESLLFKARKGDEAATESLARFLLRVTKPLITQLAPSGTRGYLASELDDVHSQVVVRCLQKAILNWNKEGPASLKTYLWRLMAGNGTVPGLIHDHFRALRNRPGWGFEPFPRHDRRLSAESGYQGPTELPDDVGRPWGDSPILGPEEEFLREERELYHGALLSTLHELRLPNAKDQKILDFRRKGLSFPNIERIPGFKDSRNRWYRRIWPAVTDHLARKNPKAFEYFSDQSSKTS
jgi:hypothetical protein